MLPPHYCGLGAGSIPFRAIVNKKQCEGYLSLVIPLLNTRYTRFPGCFHSSKCNIFNCLSFYTTNSFYNDISKLGVALLKLRMYVCFDISTIQRKTCTLLQTDKLAGVGDILASLAMHTELCHYLYILVLIQFVHVHR